MAKKAKAKAPRKLVIYKTYSFKEQDPIVDFIRRNKESAGHTDKEIAEVSGVSAGTLRNWFVGKTKRPQFATVAAAAAAMSVTSLPIRSR